MVWGDLGIGVRFLFLHVVCGLRHPPAECVPVVVFQE